VSIGGTEALPASESGSALDFLDIGGEIAARSPLQLFWRRLRQDRVALVSGVIIVALIVIAVAAPLIIKILGLPGPNVQNLNLTDEFGSPLGPTGSHPFGVDQLGHDVMARVIYGTRVSLEVGIIGTTISTLIGVVVGLLAGYYRGWVDTVISRLVDVVLSIPLLLLGIGIGAACAVKGCLGGTIQPGLSVIIFLIVFATWPYMARIVRGLVLSLREREFVEAAKSLGAKGPRIWFTELLPNLWAPILVYLTLILPTNVSAEAALSFLGVGVRAPTPTLGNILTDSVNFLQPDPMYFLLPGLFIFTFVLACNLLGDGLRDALDPKADRT
jgi:peptide/nickel transport system permease protein